MERKAHKTSSYRELQATKGSWEWQGYFPQGRAHLLIIQYQWSTLKTYIPVTYTYRLNATVRNVYEYTYMHVITISANSRKEWKVYVRVWRKKREGRNAIILFEIFLKRVFLHSIDDNVKGVANRVGRKHCLIRNSWRSSTLHHANIDAAPPHHLHACKNILSKPARWFNKQAIYKIQFIKALMKRTDS